MTKKKIRTMDMVLVVHGKRVTWWLREIITIIIGLPVGSSGFLNDVFATSAAPSVMWNLQQWQIWRRTFSNYYGHSKPIHTGCYQTRREFTNSGTVMPHVTLTSFEILNSHYMNNGIGMSEIMIQSAQLKKKKTRNTWLTITVKTSRLHLS